jgi:cyclopropane-fatty-acyl-phospholipid synthase
MLGERARVQEELAVAGIEVEGGRPWDIKVLDPRFYARFVGGGSLGLGGSYVDGWWDCDSLDQFFHRLLLARLDERARRPGQAMWMGLRRAWFNLQTAARSFQVAEKHYDLGNDLFRHMLDRRMVYTCGYWRDAQTLEEAQEAKLELVCSKLGLRAGQTLLDIGCGWGSLLGYAAEKYGVRAVGITVSREQAALARELCPSSLVDVRLTDYRELRGRFDHIASLGMFEHVGRKNYRRYFEVVRNCLADDGRFLLHTISSADLNNEPDPWIEKHIFPNSMVPTARDIVEAADRLFHLRAWQDIGEHYDPTLMAWFKNFDSHWDSLRRAYDQRFYRKWKYYLLACAGAFRARRNQVWQIVMEKA